MSVGNENFLTEMDIRLFLRDVNPADNTLLDDFEFGQEEIRTASTLAVDYWNEITPDLGRGYTVVTFPYRYHLLMGTCANLMFIAANLYRRNKLDYNVPGGGISDQDKYREYDATGIRMWRDYQAWCAQKKRAINFGLGWGTIG